MDAMADKVEKVDVVVVGGGLAGLSAAAVLAKEGCGVLVLERSRQMGGRAGTQVRDGVHFNLGAHALYIDGHAMRLLKRLGVTVQGAIPSPGKSLLVIGNRTAAMPTGLGSLMASRVLTWREKLTMTRLLAGLQRIDPRPWDHKSAADWVRIQAGEGVLAQFLHALLRLTTYANDPERLSAGAAIEQLQFGLKNNVWYLDGGWQSLVEGVVQVIERQGGEVRKAAHVEQIESDGRQVQVRLQAGASIVAKVAILAADPETAVDLLGVDARHPLAAWARSALPARAACLDLALRRLPKPEQRFALGLDQATYFSVHSAAAKLGPEGVAVVHLMKYLGAKATQEVEAIERDLEQLLDVVQPGWREEVIVRRFLPNMLVTHAIPLASQGGMAGRIWTSVPDRPRVYLAGDWVGQEGQLADASCASGEAAARQALAALAQESTEERLTHARAG